jgi:hypothetical protein
VDHNSIWAVVCLVLVVVAFISGGVLAKTFYMPYVKDSFEYSKKYQNSLQEKIALHNEKIVLLEEVQTLREEYADTITLIGEYLRDNHSEAYKGLGLTLGNTLLAESKDATEMEMVDAS